MIGKPSDELLDNIIETMPLQISVIDENDKVVCWNKHETRVFKRPKSVIGKDVRDCHPKKSLHKVEQILDEMKKGKRDKARFWINLPVGENKEEHKILIEYYALRNEKGDYIGCLEASQDIEDIQSLEGEKRLLD